MSDPHIKDEVDAVQRHARHVLSTLLRLADEWTHYTATGNLIRHDHIVKAKDDAAKLQEGLDGLLRRSHREYEEAEARKP